MPCITVDMLDKAVDSISNNTASSHDSIAIEHIKYAHPSLIIILCKLFNICLQLGIVPNDFCHGIVTPIPKFKGSKVNVVPDDFRSITVSPTASKNFEHCLLPFLECLKTSSRQFGFKKGFGCLNSIHMVRKVVNMLNKSGNTVNLCFVDIRKAFDRANIYGILCKLKQHSIHSRVINVLESWLCNSSVSVKWGDAVSDKISLVAGVR